MKKLLFALLLISTPCYALTIDNPTIQKQLNCADVISTGSIIRLSPKIEVPNYISFDDSNNNTKIGYQSGKNLDVGAGQSTFVGYQAGLGGTVGGTTDADSNCGFGYRTLYANTVGLYNVAVGNTALFANTGSYNTAVGGQSLTANSTGSSNTALGHLSLLSNATGSGNVGVGAYAGAYETGSNAFYVNNQDRTDTAGDKATSLIYGQFAVHASDQVITFNANSVTTGTSTVVMLKVPTNSVGANDVFLTDNTTTAIIPPEDGFRIRYQDNYFATNNDALVFEKTDGNDADPDGGMAFVNTGNDGIPQQAMSIRGNGAVYMNVSATCPVVYASSAVINSNSTQALLVEQDGVKDNTLVVDTTNGRVALGTGSVYGGTNNHSSELTIEKVGASSTLALDFYGCISSDVTSLYHQARIYGKFDATDTYTGGYLTIALPTAANAWADKVYVTQTGLGIGITPAVPLDVDANSNTVGVRIRGLDGANEIADVYVYSDKQLFLDTRASTGGSPYIGLIPKDTSYGLVLFNGTAGIGYPFLNIFVNDTTIDYTNFCVNADKNTLGLTIDANQKVTANAGLSTANTDITAIKTATFNSEIDNGNSGAAKTINWTSGAPQKVTVSEATTLTFTDPVGPTNLILKIVNGGTGISWTAGDEPKWAGGTDPTWTASGTDILACYFDGTTYYGSVILDAK